MKNNNKNNLSVPIPVITEEIISNMALIFRGQYVLLDSDLAALYGYSTKDFNRQVKNNIEKFDSDFMFRLNAEEMKILASKDNISGPNQNDDLRCNNSTSKYSDHGGRRYAPYVFTEQGIYMLMTVLKGPLAVSQSKALIRTFKKMKDYIVENQPLLRQREYLQLSIQTSDNTRDIMENRISLSKLDDKVAGIVDKLGEMVKRSELSDFMLDFNKPVFRRDWLIMNGQPVESDIAYREIYASAKKSVFVVDNYIGIKSLALLSDLPETVDVIIFTDNLCRNRLSDYELSDFKREYPGVNISLKSAGGIIHDRYIVVDYGLETEEVYHCGASSKDGGNKVMTITLVSDSEVYHPLIDTLLKGSSLVL